MAGAHRRHIGGIGAGHRLQIEVAPLAAVGLAAVVPFVEQEIGAGFHGGHLAAARLAGGIPLGGAGRHQQLGRNLTEVLDQRLSGRQTLGRQGQFLAIDDDAQFESLGVAGNFDFPHALLLAQRGDEFGNG